MFWKTALTSLLLIASCCSQKDGIYYQKKPAFNWESYQVPKETHVDATDKVQNNHPFKESYDDKPLNDIIKNVLSDSINAHGKGYDDYGNLAKIINEYRFQLEDGKYNTMNSDKQVTSTRLDVDPAIESEEYVVKDAQRSMQELLKFANGVNKSGSKDTIPPKAKKLFLIGALFRGGKYGWRIGKGIFKRLIDIPIIPVIVINGD